MLKKNSIFVGFTLILITFFFVIISISFSFPDLFAMFYVPSFLNEGNIYTLVKKNKEICPWLDATYPPLYYFTIGTYINLIKALKLIKNELFNISSISSCPVWNILLDKSFLFWAKIPFLLFHFFSAYFFQKMFKKNNLRWFFFWLLNPVLIFINFIQGQYDIIPTFFIILSLYFAFGKKKNYSAISLGLGAAYKHYPYLLLPAFVFILNKNIKERIKYTFLSFIPFILSVIPLFNRDYLIFLNFSENYRMFQLGFYLWNFKISYYLVAYLFLTIFLLKETRDDFLILVKYCFLFSLLYFIFTPGWFVQRLLLLVPFLLIISAYNDKIFNFNPFFYLLYFLYTITYFYGLFDHSLLRPIFNDIKTFNYSLIFINYAKQIIVVITTCSFLCLFYFGIKKISEKERDFYIKDILISFSSLLFYLIFIVLLVIITGSN